MDCLANLGSHPCAPEARRLFSGCSPRGWGAGGGSSPGFAFLGAVGNCSRKTSRDFFSLSSFALMLFQLLPLDLPSPQRVLVSMHPSSFFPPSLPPPPLHPSHVREERCISEASLRHRRCDPVSHPRTTIGRAAFSSLPFVGPDRFRAHVQMTKEAFALDFEMPRE